MTNKQPVFFKSVKAMKETKEGFPVKGIKDMTTTSMYDPGLTVDQTKDRTRQLVKRE